MKWFPFFRRKKRKTEEQVEQEASQPQESPETEEVPEPPEEPPAEPAPEPEPEAARPAATDDPPAEAVPAETPSSGDVPSEEPETVATADEAPDVEESEPVASVDEAPAPAVITDQDEPAVEEDKPAAIVAEAPTAAQDEPEPSDTPQEEELAEEALVEEPEETGGRKRGGFFARLRAGLGRTRQNLTERVSALVAGRPKMTEELYEELEDTLIQADIGVPTTMEIVDGVRERFSTEKGATPEDLPRFVTEEMKRVLAQAPQSEFALPDGNEPRLYMVVGVNGSGKTTTIGKLAARFQREGRRVILGAGDTFRAAAIDQLAVWAERANAEIIRHQEGSDPAAVAFDTIHAARSRNADVVILDTAGRLQSKVNLMRELTKVYRVVEREWGRQPDEVLLVIDATTGQNGLSQAKLFKEAVPLTGVVLTKLDGTAKGGIVLAIAAELGLPVKLIGIGESVDDLRDFDADDFVRAISPS